MRRRSFFSVIPAGTGPASAGQEMKVEQMFLHILREGSRIYYNRKENGRNILTGS